MSIGVRQARLVGIARVVALAALLALAVCSVSQDRQNAVKTGKDEEEIKHLISMYAQAADEADPTLASRVWCDSPEDSLINPVGRWHGVEEIMGFYRHDMGENYSSRSLKVKDISVRVYTDAAWAEFNWDSQQHKEKMDRRSHSTGWKPRFTARTATAGAWFMFTILRCRQMDSNAGRRIRIGIWSDWKRKNVGNRSFLKAGSISGLGAFMKRPVLLLASSLAVVAVCSGVLFLAWTPRIPPIIRDEEYGLYSDWARSRFSKNPPQVPIYILSRTFKFNPFEEPSGCSYSMIQKSGVAGSLIRQLGDLGDAEYLFKDNPPFALRVPWKYKLIDSSPDLPPGAFHLLAFSRVAFSWDRRQALFAVSDACAAGLCGTGGAVYALKGNGAWKFKPTGCIWKY